MFWYYFPCWKKPSGVHVCLPLSGGGGGSSPGGVPGGERKKNIYQFVSRGGDDAATHAPTPAADTWGPLTTLITAGGKESWLWGLLWRDDMKEPCLWLPGRGGRRQGENCGRVACGALSDAGHTDVWLLRWRCLSQCCDEKSCYYWLICG